MCALLTNSPKRSSVLQVENQEMDGYSFETNQSPAPSDAAYDCAGAVILVCIWCELYPGSVQAVPHRQNMAKIPFLLTLVASEAAFPDTIKAGSLVFKHLSSRSANFFSYLSFRPRCLSRNLCEQRIVGGLLK